MRNIAVLMSTYNGERYLGDQLDSIAAQEGVNVTLIVRDDGSTDGSKEILRAREQDGELTCIVGNNIRPARSFLELSFAAPDGEFYAFADQDDIWLPHKLRRAIDALQSIDSKTPALYFANATLADEKCRPVRTMLRTKREPNLSNALVQCYTIGATMVMNAAARVALLRHGMPLNMVMHDWWSYLVIAAVGKVIYDPEPTILYRQHDSNVYGAIGHREYVRTHWRDVLRAKTMLQGRAQARDLLAMYGAELSDTDREEIKRFVATGMGVGALTSALRLPVYKTHPLGTLVARLQWAACSI